MTAELDAAKVREAVAYVQRKAEAADAADPATWYPSCVLRDDHHHEPIEAAFISACTPTRLLLLCQAALDSLAQRETVEKLHNKAEKFLAERDQQRELVGEMSRAMAGLKDDLELYKSLTATNLKAYEKQLVVAGQLRSELEAAREELQQAWDSSRKEQTARITAQRELEAARAERDRLQKDLDHKTALCTRISRGSEDCDQTIAELRTQLSTAQADLTKMKEECTSTDAEWQQHLMQLHEGYTGDGCESGDPRDWTRAAISRRINALDDDLHTAQADAQGLREALSIFYRWMQQERTDKSRMSVDQMIGILHRVIPEEVEKDQRQRAALGAGGEEG